jgi:hypothetical protein
MAPLFRCVGLGVVVQHLFMVLGGEHNMTSPGFGTRFFI